MCWKWTGKDAFGAFLHDSRFAMFLEVQMRHGLFCPERGRRGSAPSCSPPSPLGATLPEPSASE